MSEKGKSEFALTHKILTAHSGWEKS